MATAAPLQQGSDPTFRAYNSDQAKQYSEARLAYPRELYDTILRYHADSNGRFENLVDAGCGPGKATRELAPFFRQAIGADPSEKMIQTACQLGGTTAAGLPVRYHVSTAEALCDLGDGSVLGRVDLLTAATAAHWFDMPEFWSQAARLVRPGGTVALWTTGRFYCHPSTPNAATVNQIMADLETEVLSPFELPPNAVSRNLYDDLELPWSAETSSVETFPQSQFIRMAWDRDGELSDGKDFLGGSSTVSLELLQEGYGTGSTVTRWRAAHPDLAHTEADCVVQAIEKIREAIGPEAGGTVRGGLSTGLLLFKRL
ncbi:S-adenosyl-L-methionine-dependent methyltransferase [Aspergillus falconensis]